MLALLAGCVDEHDVDAWAALPSIAQACETLGAQAASFDVQPLDEPAFTLEAGPCSDQVGGHGFAGFHVRIERLTTGYHRIDVVIADPDGAPLGEVSQPFSSRGPLIVPFSRADLPGWPTASIEVEVPSCAPGGPISLVTVTATPALSAAPAATEQILCTPAPPVAPPRVTTLVVPAGPVTLDAIGVAADGTPCWSGTLDASAPSQAPLSLSLIRSCP